jgi:hypothetical protein
MAFQLRLPNNLSGQAVFYSGFMSPLLLDLLTVTWVVSPLAFADRFVFFSKLAHNVSCTGDVREGPFGILVKRCYGQ